LVVVTLMESGNLSTSELASELGYTKITATLSKALKELMAEGVVQYLEPEKVRSRNQKLHLVKGHRNG
ncbi:MAG: AAA family ATPase, partial [Eubacteriales bacterium]|nr:AAA family ATPase [Eubacteriales bacterium]